jgi:ParB-like chromosome segregation protein Spo0J
MSTEVLNLDLIRIDGNTQSRIRSDDDLINHYAERMEEGDEFPPVVVFLDGKDYWLSDGFHRYHATRKNGEATIKVKVLHGTKRDAKWHGMGANISHGKPPTREDKRHNIEIILHDIEWEEKSDREIAKHCGVSNTFVSKMRKELMIEPSPTLEVTRKGKTKTIANPANKKKKDEPFVSTLTGTDKDHLGDFDPKDEQIDALTKDNHDLTFRLAITAMEATPEEKSMAEELIADLRAEVITLQQNIKSLTISRDTYQAENGELKKQIASLQKKIKKLEGK